MPLAPDCSVIVVLTCLQTCKNFCATKWLHHAVLTAHILRMHKQPFHLVICATHLGGANFQFHMLLFCSKKQNHRSEKLNFLSELLVEPFAAWKSLTALWWCPLAENLNFQARAGGFHSIIESQHNMGKLAKTQQLHGCHSDLHAFLATTKKMMGASAVVSSLGCKSMKWIQVRTCSGIATSIAVFFHWWHHFHTILILNKLLSHFATPHRST